jgi:cell division protein FtsN
MRHQLVLSVIVLAATAACKRDAPANDTAQQGVASKAVDSALRSAPAPAPAGTKAPTPGGTKAPARPAAAPTVAPTPAPASTELASARTVYTVQVASYLNGATAQAQKARLERAGVPAWTATATVGGQEFTRVRIGAATNAADARAVANKIQATYHYPVWVTRVENRAALPGDALSVTRAYASGS